DIDLLYERARKAGAYGGKLLGAGGGGFIFFFAPPEIHDRIKKAVPEVKVWVPFKFESDGSQIIFHTDQQQEKAEVYSIQHI
ncbi:MAG: kinase, partial [Elusimicrobiota bacterium]